MDATAVSVKSPDLAMSQTELANRRFLSEVQKISEVITAKPYGGRTLAEQSIAVVVPAMRSSTSRQVFELEGEILRAYPDARLNVRVIGLEERGLDESHIEAVFPGEELYWNTRQSEEKNDTILPGRKSKHMNTK